MATNATKVTQAPKLGGDKPKGGFEPLKSCDGSGKGIAISCPIIKDRGRH